MIAPAVIREYLTASQTLAGASTLSAEASAAATTLALVSGSSFSDDLTVLVSGTEKIIAKVASNTATAYKRGALGTTAAIHTAGAAVIEAALYSVVGSRVNVQPPATNASPYVWIQLAEYPNPYGPWSRCQLTARCFGGSDSELDALAVYALLQRRLHRAFHVQTSFGWLMGAVQTGGGEVLTDPDVGWKFVPAIYDVEVA